MRHTTAAAPYIIYGVFFAHVKPFLLRSTTPTSQAQPTTPRRDAFSRPAAICRVDLVFRLLVPARLAQYSGGFRWWREALFF